MSTHIRTVLTLPEINVGPESFGAQSADQIRLEAELEMVQALALPEPWRAIAFALAEQRWQAAGETNVDTANPGE